MTSLDLLSGGRVELGLGAGAFWDGVVAMGGQRRTPAESIEALEEAITVVRGIWDADAKSPLTVEASDDTASTERYAAEIAPAVRELVARER